MLLLYHWNWVRTVCCFLAGVLVHVELYIGLKVLDQTSCGQCCHRSTTGLLLCVLLGIPIDGVLLTCQPTIILLLLYSGREIVVDGQRILFEVSDEQQKLRFC